jgi:hypothetical protein
MGSSVRTEVVEKCLEAEALALERPREMQLRHISSRSQGALVLGGSRWRWTVAVLHTEGGGEERRWRGAVAVEKKRKREIVYAEGFRWGGSALVAE